MTRERYIRMTETTRRAVSRLPGGTKALRAPTLLCAAIYCASLLYLMFTGDRRIIRAVIVPAVCFAVVTVLRPLIGKQRPYDRYGVPPGRRLQTGQGKEHAQPPHGQRRRHRLRDCLCLSASGGHRVHGAAQRGHRQSARALRPARYQRRSGRVGAEPRHFPCGLPLIIYPNFTGYFLEKAIKSRNLLPRGRGFFLDVEMQSNAAFQPFIFKSVPGVFFML